MTDRAKYRKRADRQVTAVQLALETDGFSYRKWGGWQRCRAGDWLVENDGDVYTVNRESFAATYRQVQPGRYIKVAPVWAARAVAAGRIDTKEGATAYQAGDYLVSNEEIGTDAYAMTAETFESMYEPAE